MKSLRRPSFGSGRVQELMAELTDMVGLESVKEAVGELRDLVEYDFFRKSWFGVQQRLMDQSFHMTFLGNPGSGKTVVARIVGELLLELKVIKPNPNALHTP